MKESKLRFTTNNGKLITYVIKKKKKKTKKTLKEKMLQHYSLQLLLQDQPRPVSKVLILPLYIPAVCGQHKMTGYNINKKKSFP